MKRTGQHILVLGAGASGIGAAKLLTAQGAHVALLDGSTSEKLSRNTQALTAQGVDVLLGVAHIPEGEWDCCVVSPGVSPGSSLLLDVRHRNIPVLPEIEVAWESASGPVIGITGSNGKTSMVHVAADALKLAGRNPYICGNCGPAFSTAVYETGEADPWVVELSSFQLETISRFRVDVALLLNILPNHFDRHVSLSAYRDAKWKLFQNADVDDWCIIPEQEACHIHTASKWLLFGRSDQAHAQYRPGEIRIHGAKGMDIAGSTLDNPVWGVNLAGLAAALYSCDIPLDALETAVHQWNGLPHRMQYVDVVQGVTFINDSKATNLAAMKAAVSMAEPPVLLIAGGRAKEEDLNILSGEFSGAVKRMYLIGEAAPAMYREWHASLECVVCSDLCAAMESIQKDAEPGDTVLLSPGCASFDQFSSYEERGNCFTQVVAKLREESPS